MTEANFLEMNYEEALSVTGGSITLGAVIGAIATVVTLVGGAYTGYKAMEEAAYDKAYKEAYEEEMLKQNLANPIPLGDLIREHYQQ